MTLSVPKCNLMGFIVLCSWSVQKRNISMEPIYTEDDKEFTVQEILNAVASMGGKKAPGADSITGEIYKGTFKNFPNYIMALYKDASGKGYSQQDGKEPR